MGLGGCFASSQAVAVLLQLCVRAVAAQRLAEVGTQREICGACRTRLAKRSAGREHRPPAQISCGKTRAARSRVYRHTRGRARSVPSCLPSKLRDCRCVKTASLPHPPSLWNIAHGRERGSRAVLMTQASKMMARAWFSRRWHKGVFSQPSSRRPMAA